MTGTIQSIRSESLGGKGPKKIITSGYLLLLLLVFTMLPLGSELEYVNSNGALSKTPCMK